MSPVPPAFGRILPGSPPEQLAGVIFRTPFLQVSRGAALIRLPDGTRLHYCRRAGGVQVQPDGDPVALMPILTQTVFAIAAWLDGLVPLPLPGLVKGSELFLFHGQSAVEAEALAALLAQAGRAEVCGGMVALSGAGLVRLNGTALATDAGFARAHVPELAGAPTREGATRVWLAPAPAPAGDRRLAVTLIATTWDNRDDHVVTPQDSAGTLALIASMVFLPELGRTLLGPEGLAQRLHDIAGTVTAALIASGKSTGRPESLARLLIPAMGFGGGVP